jgi:hypothetical protein
MAPRSPALEEAPEVLAHPQAKTTERRGGGVDPQKRAPTPPVNPLRVFLWGGVRLYIFGGCDTSLYLALGGGTVWKLHPG